MWYTYVIQSLKDSKYYIGMTGNLEQRIVKHNAGATNCTRYRGPWKLVYFEQFQTKTEALKRERKIKSYKGGDAFKKLINMGR